MEQKIRYEDYQFVFVFLSVWRKNSKKSVLSFMLVEETIYLSQNRDMIFKLFGKLSIAV